MKKNKFLIILLSPVIILPALVLAGSGPAGTPIFSNPLVGVNSVTDLLVRVLDIVIQVGLVVIVFFIIFAGFKFVTARGNSTKLTEARDALISALVGSAIILGSYAIASALKSTVDQLKEGTNVTQLEEKLNFKV